MSQEKNRYVLLNSNQVSHPHNIFGCLNFWSVSQTAQAVPEVGRHVMLNADEYVICGFGLKSRESDNS